jgi:hypothetical protein
LREQVVENIDIENWFALKLSADFGASQPVTVLPARWDKEANCRIVPAKLKFRPVFVHYPFRER